MRMCDAHAAHGQTVKETYHTSRRRNSITALRHAVARARGKAQKQLPKQPTQRLVRRQCSHYLIWLTLSLIGMHRSTSDSQCKRARNDQSINLSVIYLQTQRPCISDGRRRDLHLGIWHSTRPVYRILSVSARPAGQMCLGTGDDDGWTRQCWQCAARCPPARSATPHPSICYVSIAFRANIRPRPSARQLDASSVNPGSERKRRRES